MLSLLPREGRGINVALDEALLHSVCGLLRNIVAKTGWDIKLDWPQAVAAAAEAPQKPQLGWLTGRRAIENYPTS